MDKLLSISFTRSRAAWTAVLTVAVLCGAFTPQAARAHDGEPAVAETRVHDRPAAKADAVTLETARLSPFCPAGPGSQCGCGNATALCRVGKGPYLVAILGTASVRVRPGALPHPAGESAPPAAPRYSPARPRAPPFSS